MSLLEDVFLEDEAGEAQELERVIEGDEFDERPRTPNSNDDSEKEDEAEEDKRRVDHTAKAKRSVKNPRFVLNPARLTGPRGIQVIPEHFKDFNFKGKGHEREDLDCVLKKLEHWAYRLYPKFKFDDCLKKIETLGKKRPVMVHLHKIRTDQFMSEETVVQKDSSDDEAEIAPVQEEDEFDRLLQQQIELARSTPAPSSVRKELHTPAVNKSPLATMAPKAFSSPSISDEQKERMIRNKKLAEERRLAKLNQLNNSTVNGASSEAVLEESRIEVRNKENNDGDDSGINGTDRDDNDIAVVRKHHRSNVIDSSDDESNVIEVNESISVDVHNTIDNKVPNHDTKNTETEKMDMKFEENTNSDAEIEVENKNIKNNESTVIQIDSEQCKTIDDEISDTENTVSEATVVESENNINSVDIEIEGGNENSKNNEDNVIATDSNRQKTIEVAISNTENTALEVMPVESEGNVNSADKEIDTNVTNVKANSFSHKTKEDALKHHVATIESDTNAKMIAEDPSNGKTIDESDPNFVNISNLSNGIMENVDETITDKQSVVDKNNEIENNEVPVEDLMDVDFSDDF